MGTLLGKTAETPDLTIEMPEIISSYPIHDYARLSNHLQRHQMLHTGNDDNDNNNNNSNTTNNKNNDSSLCLI